MFMKKNNIKKMKYILFTILSFTFSTVFVFADETTTTIDYQYFCNNPGVMDVFRILSYILLIAKIVAPILIIVFGMIDYTKAITSNDEKAISKATKALVRRFVTGLLIVLAPTMLLALVHLIDDTKAFASKNHYEFGKCTRCLLNYKECDN